MLEVYQKKLIISPSNADSTGRMSYPAAFSIFQDMAAEHAEFMNLGFAAMAEKNRFWLTVKTKILFYRRPVMAENVTVSTWLEPPEKIRCNRNYDIQSNGEILVAGKTDADRNHKRNKEQPHEEGNADGLQYSIHIHIVYGKLAAETAEEANSHACCQHDDSQYVFLRHISFPVKRHGKQAGLTVIQFIIAAGAHGQDNRHHAQERYAENDLIHDGKPDSQNQEDGNGTALVSEQAEILYQ